MRGKTYTKRMIRHQRTDGFSRNARLVWGFTLIETMVAMGIFTVLIALVAAIFLVGLRTQRNQVDLLLASDNLSLALEQMVREIRTGGNFCIPVGVLCPPGVTSGNILRFQNANSEQVIYSFNATLESIERSSDGGTTYIPITGGNVSVRGLNFTRVDKLTGFAASQPWPPRILIVIEAGSQKPGLQGISTNIQATVSARNI